jgi:6-phosphogluconolactonase
MLRNHAKLALCLIVLCLPLMAFAGPDSHAVGAVYTMTNAGTGNSVVIFDRYNDGTLSAPRTVSTGGKGLGLPLASQGSIVLTANNRYLLVSNAGSDDISVFSVGNNRIDNIGVYPSGGHIPYSIAVSGDLVYVLNAGDATHDSNVTGFRMDAQGALTPIPDSARLLSNSHFADPAQVGFNPSGDKLVVTERATNSISVFPVDGETGLLGTLVSSPSSAPTPYGFVFAKQNELIIAEANGMAANMSSMSSYILNEDGTLTVVTAAATTHQTAACWVAVGKGGRFTYTTNALSASISGYSIDPTGALELLTANGRTGVTASGLPVDDAFSIDGRFLYALTLTLPPPLQSGISSFRVEPNGNLTTIQDLHFAFLFAAGIAVR